jgi:hypothetical protein
MEYQKKKTLTYSLSCPLKLSTNFSSSTEGGTDRKLNYKQIPWHQLRGKHATLEIAATYKLESNG